ncbi:hypothetical protein DB347_22990 [Opitutaceae bacterium EW11]|nr:hypothetical protein DB347_22990 [Opitutaceae bacterium EW11]
MTPSELHPRWSLPPIVCALAVAVACIGTAANAALDTPIVVTLVPKSTAAAPATRNSGGLARDDRFDGGRLVLVGPGGDARVLTEGFESACDPSVSFDGKTLLFSGRKTAGAPWRVWEMGVDGTGLRAITPETMDARHPIHVSTLFTLDSPQPWKTLVFVGRDAATHSDTSPTRNLYNITLDGRELRRLTYQPGESLDPFQMWDGRVLYVAERYSQEPPARAGRLGLFAVHFEGADMELYGAELGRRVQQMPCATEKGLVLFIESDEASSDGAGQIAWVEQRRPHVTYHAPKRTDARRYRFPSPLQANEVLVAQHDPRGKSRWTIVRFDADSGAVSPVFASKDQDAVQAVAVRARRVPDGHSTVVTSNDNFGTLYGLDCYTADAARSGKLRPGEVKRVRLIEGLASASAGASSPRRLIGEAAVETDGSFNLFVPSDTPLLLQTVDENGMALGTCGWIWVKPKEKRGCIGCHEDPERVPENRFVLALHHDSVPLLPPVAERRTVTFTRDVAPILQRAGGAGLVDARQRPLRLALDTPAGRLAAYQTLTQGRGALVEPGRARTSPLVWQLLGRNTSRPWDSAAKNAGPAQSRPTAPGSHLSAEELRTLILWIDLGAAYDAPTFPAPTETDTAGK